jgi:hypothetical protein
MAQSVLGSLIECARTYGFNRSPELSSKCGSAAIRGSFRAEQNKVPVCALISEWGIARNVPVGDSRK